MSIYALAMSIIGGGLALCVVGIFAARKLSGLHFREEHKDLAGYVLQIMGTFYAVLIAFAVITTWQRHHDAQAVADAEANNLNDTFRIAQGLCVPERDEFRKTIIEYGRLVIEEEWACIPSGEEGPRARKSYQHLWDLVSSMNPATERDKALYAAILKGMDDVSDGHRQRLIFGQGRLSGMIWFTLIAEGILIVGFSFFFGLNHLGRQAFVTAFFAGIILLNLFVIAALDQPFTGPSKVEPLAMRFVLKHMEAQLSREQKENVDADQPPQRDRQETGSNPTSTSPLGGK